MMSLYYRKIFFNGTCPEDDIATIVVANHSNAFIDPFILQVALQKRLVRTVRADWLQHWLVKWLIHLIGAVPLAQKSKGHKGNNHKSFKQLIDAMNQGRWVVIFPEGVSHNRSKLRPFKKGAAYIAEQYIKQTGKPVRVIQMAVYYGDKSHLNSDVWVTQARETLYTPESNCLQDKAKEVTQWQTAIQKTLPGPMKTDEKKQIAWLARNISAFTTQSIPLTSIKSILKRNSQLTALHYWLTQANIELDVLKHHDRPMAIFSRLLTELIIFFTGLPLALFSLITHMPVLGIHYWLIRYHSTAEDKWASNAYVVGIPLYLSWWLFISLFLSQWLALLMLATGLYSLFYWQTCPQRIRVLTTASHTLSEPGVRRLILNSAESALFPFL